MWTWKSSVTVACFPPSRANYLSAPQLYDLHIWRRYLCLYKFIPCTWLTLQMVYWSVNVGECLAWDNTIYIVLLPEDWRISLNYLRKTFHLRHRLCACRVLLKIVFRRQIKLSKTGASINAYNLRNCPKNHFLQQHLQSEKELKPVEYDRTKSKLQRTATVPMYSRRACLQSLSA